MEYVSAAMAGGALSLLFFWAGWRSERRRSADTPDGRAGAEPQTLSLDGFLAAQQALDQLDAIVSRSRVKARAH